MIVICDIDGTLSDPSHRRDHLKNRDWVSFFSEMDKDPPVKEYCELVKILLHSSTLRVIFVTGRPEEYKEKTIDWLKIHVSFDEDMDELYMRTSGDYRADYIVKEEILRQLKTRFGENISLVIDDRPSVVEMWKRNGLTVLQAPGWEREGYNRPRSPVLDILVGPSGSGKSRYASEMFEPDSVISTDALRQDLLGNWKDNSKNDLIFFTAHRLIENRIDLGLDTVFDATNLRNRDRRAILDLLDDSVKVFYHVIDRPMEKKIEDGGWRNDVEVKGKPLMEYHQDVFRSNIKDIMAGDNDPRVTVVDLRGQTRDE